MVIFVRLSNATEALLHFAYLFGKSVMELPIVQKGKMSFYPNVQTRTLP